MQVKKKIQEVIVVEGRHDTEKLRKYFDCDTIETGGTSLGEDVLERIKHAQKTRGVIVFTDPDSPGNRIRNAVNQYVPGCKNAFVMKKDARTDKKVGVEHAEFDVLNEALENLVTYQDVTTSLTMNDMIELGLSGNTNSSALRDKVGEYYHIGSGNAKTMLRRMNFLHLTKEEIRQVVEE